MEDIFFNSNPPILDEFPPQSGNINIYFLFFSKKQNSKKKKNLVSFSFSDFSRQNLQIDSFLSKLKILDSTKFFNSITCQIATQPLDLFRFEFDSNVQQVKQNQEFSELTNSIFNNKNKRKSLESEQQNQQLDLNYSKIIRKAFTHFQSLHQNLQQQTQPLQSIQQHLSPFLDCLIQCAGSDFHWKSVDEGEIQILQVNGFPKMIIGKKEEELLHLSKFACDQLLLKKNSNQPIFSIQISENGKRFVCNVLRRDFNEFYVFGRLFDIDIGCERTHEELNLFALKKEFEKFVELISSSIVVRDTCFSDSPFHFNNFKIQKNQLPQPKRLPLIGKIVEARKLKKTKRVSFENDLGELEKENTLNTPISSTTTIKKEYSTTPIHIQKTPQVVELSFENREFKASSGNGSSNTRRTLRFAFQDIANNC